MREPSLCGGKVAVADQDAAAAATTPPRRPKPLPPLQKAWSAWVQSLPADARAALEEVTAEAAATTTTTQAGGNDATHDEFGTLKFPYHRYANLVVVNRTVLGRGLLRMISTDERLQRHWSSLWGAVARELGVSHVGATGPIPLELGGKKSPGGGHGGDGDIHSDDNNDNDGDCNPSVPDDANSTRTKLDNGSNVLRSPTAFLPLYGDFGGGGQGDDSGVESVPARTTTSTTTKTSITANGTTPFSREAADRLFWARAVQGGIVQVWSPLHTMFSAGNVREKERVLGFGRAATTSGGKDSRWPSSVSPSTAVDLYAGIGYFAFCYRRRVADVVLCWEINPWSVEGFRRGAAANHWGREVAIVGESCNDDGNDGAAAASTFSIADLPPEMVVVEGDGNDHAADHSVPRLRRGLVMFAESNERAPGRVRRLRAALPPVRHVNCGYLPTSEPAWATAVSVLDPRLGGWVHAHENIGVGDIESRTAEIEARFRALAGQCYADRVAHSDDEGDHSPPSPPPPPPPLPPTVSCDGVARVKTYAPGVVHCVLDIHIQPEPGGRTSET